MPLVGRHNARPARIVLGEARFRECQFIGRSGSPQRGSWGIVADGQIGAFHVERAMRSSCLFHVKHATCANCIAFPAVFHVKHGARELVPSFRRGRCYPSELPPPFSDAA